jgi:thioredoxin-related protein
MKGLLLLLITLFTLSFAQGQEWKTDFEQAKHEAEQRNCDILMLFQGSDWCSVCMRLDKEILSTDEFKARAQENYVLLKVDFPRRKTNALSKEQQAKNNQLAEKYNRKGYFPLVVILNKDGEVLGETGYKKMSPDDYMNLLSTLSR